MAYKKHASVKEVANLPASATLVEKVELSLCGRKFTQSHFEWNPADAYLTGIWKSRDSKSLTWLASLAEEHRQRQSQLPQGYRNWVENDYLPLPVSGRSKCTTSGRINRVQSVPPLRGENGSI